MELADTPHNAPPPGSAGLVSASGTGHRCGVPLRLRLSGHALRAETAWLRAHGRLWRFVIRARPFARIAPGRRLSGRDTGGLAALPPAPTPSSTPGLSPALRSSNLRTDHSRLTIEIAQAPLGWPVRRRIPRTRYKGSRAFTAIDTLIVAAEPTAGGNPVHINHQSRHRPALTYE